MAKLVKYFVYGGGSSFTEFDLDFAAAGISLKGTEVVYTGGSGVESVYVTSGVSFDFTKASGGTDRLYFGARLSDYVVGFQGSNLILTEKSNGAVVKLLGGSLNSFDNLIFADGTAGSKALFDAARAATAMPLLDGLVKTPSLKSDLYQALGDQSASTIKAFAGSNEGVTFGTTPKPGVTMLVTGGSGVDVVYVAAGSNVDATKLSGGVDEIYMTGSLSDYTRSVVGSNLVLTRVGGVSTETVKVLSGSANAFDRLIFSDGFVKSVDLFNATKNNTALPVLDPLIKTPGLALALKPSALDGLTDLDVRSDIVLQFTEPVVSQAGKFIRIINDANTASKNGLYGENLESSFILEVSDPRVRVSGDKVIIDIDRDLDFANNYHIEIDAGAFKGVASQRLSNAVSGSGELNFSTVTPGADKLIDSTIGSSRTMRSDGSVVDSYIWKDIEGWPNGKTGGQAEIDLGGRKIALVTADLLSSKSTLALGSSATNIETGNFNLRVSNFGADDLVYMDDLGRNDESSLVTNQLIFEIQFSSEINSAFNFDAAAGKDGGVIEIVGQSFLTNAEWQTLLGADALPFVYGSTVLSDTNSPTLQSATVTPNGLAMTLTFSEALDIANFTPAQLLQRFAVGVGNNDVWPVESVSITGSVVTLNIPSSQPIPSTASLGGGVVRVSYNDLSTANDTANVVQDAAGNDVANIPGTPVTNGSTYVPPAAATIQSLNASDLIAEGASIVYTVTLSAAEPVGGFVVDWRVVADTFGDPAEAQDFGSGASSVFPSGSITVAAGQTTGQIVIPVFDDNLPESAETFVLQAGKLSSGTFTVGASRGASISASDGPQGAINGTPGNDRLTGTAGGDSIYGFAGNDTLDGQAGDDTLFGADGDDWFTGSAGSDSFDGGTGYDRADYRLLGASVSVTMATGSVVKNGIGTDTLSSIERVIGTPFDDSIVGSGANDDFSGEMGNDTLDGGSGGLDFLWYGRAPGPMTVDLQAGTAAGEGTDVLRSIEAVVGGEYADTLLGSSYDNYFQGDSPGPIAGGLGGADTIDGRGGFDTVDYREEAAGVVVDLAAGTGKDGRGFIDTLISIENAFGSPHADMLKGGNPLNGSGATDGYEGFRGNAGNDTIDGGAGFDCAQYDNSPNAVQVTLGGSSPGSARDGWRSNTSDAASDGTDTLINIEEARGSAYNDTLTGSDEAGRYESFEGRAGSDTISGRAGTDRASYQTSPNAINVNLGLGTARDGWRTNSSDPATDGTDTLTGIEEVRGSDFNDTIVGSDGNNFLDGRSGNDSIAGGAGSDTLFGEAGSDTLDGGDGDDFVTYRSSTAGIVVDLTKTAGQVQDGLGGVDTVIGIEGFIGGGSADKFIGPVAAASYFYAEGSGGADTIEGGSGAVVNEVAFTGDTQGVTARLAGWVGATGALPTGYTGSALDGSGSVDVFRNIQNLEGSKFNDFLYGDANDNNIDGRGGADVIDGGDGRDTVEFNQAGAGIHVDLSQNRVLDDGQGIGSAVADAAVEQDTLVSIENVDGGGFNDLIVGNGVGNFLQGRGGVDTLNGGGGDDTLQGGSGDDTLDGGAGVDTAGFTGAFDDYTVLIEATGIRITDKVANRDGIDQVVNVERFLFSNGEYRVSGSGVGLAQLNPQAVEVLDRMQGSGYTDAVDFDALTEEELGRTLADWIDGSIPLMVIQVESRALGDMVDNTLKYGVEFVAGPSGSPGTTTLFMRYDMNPLDAQVQPSDLIELSFPGDVRASLVPESLTYSG